jgi:S1-C subfamily serine protease
LSRFCDYFKEYERNRRRFKDIEAFYPEILSRLSRLRVEEFRRPGIMGFYPEYREDKLFIKDLVPDSALQRAGAQKDDILLAIGKGRIDSEESFNRAKEKWWNNAREGDSVEIIVLRQEKEIRISVPVPYVTDYRYVEDK